MPVRECTVSFIDMRGVRHSTMVHASTVLEAAALGLKQIQEAALATRRTAPPDRPLSDALRLRACAMSRAVPHIHA